MSSSTLKIFLKDNAVIILGTIVVNLKGLVLMPLIIKTMGVTVYGGYILLVSMLTLSFSLSSLGVGISAKRFLPSAPDMTARAKLFYPQFIFNFGMIILVSLSLWLLDSTIRTTLFNDAINYPALVIPFYLIAFYLFSQGCDYFRFTARMPRFALATTLYPYLHMGFILTLLYCFDLISIEIMVVSETVSASIIALMSLHVAFKEMGNRFSFFSWNEIKSEVGTGLPLMFTIVVDFVLAASDRYLITLFISISAVGYYNPGYILGTLVMFLPKAMGAALPQLMSKAVDNNDERTAQLMIDYTVKLFLLIGIPFVFGSLVLGKVVLVILTNQDVAESAQFITPIIALGTLFFGLTYIITNILFVRLQTGMMLKVNLLAAGINFTLNVVLLYFIRDIMVAALTTLLSYYISFIYINQKVKQIWVISYDVRFIVKVVLSSSIMAVLVYYVFLLMMGLSDVVILLTLLPLAIVAYGACLVLCNAFSAQEIMQVKAIVARKTKLG